MTVTERLAALSDRQLKDLITAKASLAGIGGRKAELDIDGTRVFVKRVPLTDLELNTPHNTANLFDLPLFYQYGLGSAGFSAWRELAAHLRTSDWPGFLRLYHWRVLPDDPPEDFADDFGGIDGAVAHWAGSQAVRKRLEAIGKSTARLVLCLEYVPHTLSAWLSDETDVPWVETALTSTTSWMRNRGFVHFDAHFGNILTDGRQLYFADLGLAVSRTFDLTPEEAAFLDLHRDYDEAYVMSGLHRRFESLSRHAETAEVIRDFHRQLMKDKHTPFPAGRLADTMGQGDADPAGT